ncbi:MAG TPA: sulfurtransferase [Gaiellaceae bacterium]
MARPRLITPGELTARLDDAELAVLEVAFMPDDGPFREGHVPRSRWAYWKDLLWHDTDREFATPEVLARRLGALGITEQQTLVLVGDPIQFAAYAFWVLHMRGRPDLLVLDGGRAAWLAGGFPTEAGLPEVEAVAHAPFDLGDESSRIGRDGVLVAVTNGDRVILDLRSPEEYRGERVAPLTAPFDHGAERKGHIPGARHLYYEELLREDGGFRSTDELRRVFAGAGVRNGEAVITYCRLSHRAALGWFALTQLLGHDDVKVYDGSWTEWGSIVGMPVER